MTHFKQQSSLNGSASNIPDGTGRSFATSFSGQSGAASPGFHHNGKVALAGIPPTCVILRLI